ncbi:MAG: hypothetical protein ACPG8W_04610 [Candidatus Promineifilaceae bacterium]
MARSNRYFKDLDEYHGCHDEEMFSLAPLGVGFLRRKQDFTTGQTPQRFLIKLATFLLSPVCAVGKAMACPLCGEHVTTQIDGKEVVLGSAEIRILGEENIYAAPDLILHFITAHKYRPPQKFIDVVMKAPGVNSAEHRALVKALA